LPRLGISDKNLFARILLCERAGLETITLILFEADERQVASANYSFPELLPGYELLGLRGWTTS
jgi:hypothetical protein